MVYVIGLCIVFILQDVSSLATWNMPRPLLGFHSYQDVSPVKYQVPPGISHMNFSFHFARNHKNCQQQLISVLIQHNGLPLVKQTNLSFPNNFLTEDGPTLMFSVQLEQLVGFSIVRPPPGTWFIIAYYDKEDTKITQKGLDSGIKCVYSYVSRLELGDPVVSKTVELDKQQNGIVGKRGTLYSFTVPPSTESFKITVEKCGTEPCNITLKYVPFDFDSSVSQDCDMEVKKCWMHITSPPLNDLSYVEISYHGLLDTQEVTFTITVKGCPSFPAPTTAPCVTLPSLDRIQPMAAFSTVFGFLQYDSISFNLNVAQAPVLVVPFELIDPNDIGGSLKWEIELSNITQLQVLSVQICAALVYNYLPNVVGDSDICTYKSTRVNHIFKLDENPPKMTHYVPYPRIGWWHVLLQAKCFDKNSDSKIPCPSYVMVDVILEVHPCIDGECTDRGSCLFVTSGSDLVTYSACHCKADYQGFACTDNTEAQSVSEQLAAAYLLTLSNLFFIPSIIISIKRRFLIEAFVYFYNMFFSSFYHACDGDRLQRYRICIIKYDVLQAADFFGSACSLWFTLVAMARIRYRYITPLLQIVGPFGILIGIIYDRTSLCVIAVPIFSGLVAITLSWGHRMYKERRLYPSWRRYVFFLLPGVALAAAGASVFAFFETEKNYKYVHSVWHMCVALCILFLLPPCLPTEFGVNTNESSMGTHLLTPVSQRRSIQSEGESNAEYQYDLT